jgi:hypothetical protein
MIPDDQCVPVPSTATLFNFRELVGGPVSPLPTAVRHTKPDAQPGTRRRRGSPARPERQLGWRQPGPTEVVSAVLYPAPLAK